MKVKEIAFPDCWEELCPPEWDYLLKLRRKLIEQKGITLNDVKREWCRFVLHNRGVRTRNRNEYYLLVYNLALTLDWMWSVSEDGKEVELTFNSTVNLLPRWRNLCGPLSHGSDLTFGEFRSAVMMMNRFHEHRDTASLQMLCGILYRKPGKRPDKPGFNGRYRELFVQERINFYAERVKGMPDFLQWGVYAWFSYFCEFLFTGTFCIDGTEVCFSSVFERKRREENRPAEQSIGMNSILFSVAESGIFGNVAQTDGTLLLRVMMKLLDDKLRADELLKQTQSTN